VKASHIEFQQRLATGLIYGTRTKFRVWLYASWALLLDLMRPSLEIAVQRMITVSRNQLEQFLWDTLEVHLFVSLCKPRLSVLMEIGIPVQCLTKAFHIEFEENLYSGLSSRTESQTDEETPAVFLRMAASHGKTRNVHKCLLVLGNWTSHSGEN
jgi:hypothetical protein